LNTWIDEEVFKDVLIAKEFPEDKCVIPNSEHGIGSMGAGGGKPMKHLELRRIRITDGYAAYFLD